MPISKPGSSYDDGSGLTARPPGTVGTAPPSTAPPANNVFTLDSAPPTVSSSLGSTAANALGGPAFASAAPPPSSPPPSSTLSSGASSALSGSSGYTGSPGGYIPPTSVSDATGTAGSSSATPASGSAAASPFGPNPLMSNPTGNNALTGGTIAYNPTWYSSQEAAQKLAQMTGGSVVNQGGATGVSNNQAQWMVQLPNGQVVYPGAIADLYTNPVTSSNPGMIDYKMAEMLNNNAVGSPDIAHHGLYTVKNGVISYDPNGQAQPTTSLPLSMSQYNNWLTRNALAGATGYGNGNQPQSGNWSTLLGSPGTGAPAVTGAPNAQQLAQLQQQYGVAPQGQQQAPATSDGLAQLAQFFALLSGGNSLNAQQQQQSGQDPQMLQLLQLIMLLSGGGNGTQQNAPLYSRAQYPRFP